MTTKVSWRDALALRRKVQEQEARIAELKAERDEAQEIITDLIGSTGIPWAEAVGRAESFLYARTQGEE